MRSRARRRALLVAGLILAPAAASLLSGCGGGGVNISVAITPDFSGAYAPDSQLANFTVTVTNRGPGNASGVVVHVAMPGSFRYQATNSISGNGDARTQPLEARVGDSNPQFGIWDLSAPTTPNGATTYAQVKIDFGVAISAEPDTYTLAPSVIDDDLTSTVAGHPLLVTVTEAPKLSLSATVSPGTVRAGGTVTYRVTVNNSGTGFSSNLGVLVTLPPVLSFQSTMTPFGGNASRRTPVNPAKGSVLVFYGGFTLPSATGLGPGTLTIVFKAAASSNPGRGVFPIQVQVTDAEGDVSSINDVAPVSVLDGQSTPTQGSAAQSP